MKNKCFKILTLVAGLSIISSSAFAVNDPPNSLLHLLREIESAIEVVENVMSKVNVIEMNKLIGDKGKIVANIVDKGSSLAYEKFAPTVTKDLQGKLKSGLKAIPEIRSYVEENFKVLSSTDVRKQAKVLVQINERLNLSSMDAYQRAKNVLAATNNVVDEAASQLKKAGDAKDMHHKFIQEAAQDIQAYKKDISLNQVTAQLLEAAASNMMANRQNATLEGTSEDEGGKK